MLSCDFLWLKYTLHDGGISLICYVSLWFAVLFTLINTIIFIYVLVLSIRFLHEKLRKKLFNEFINKITLFFTFFFNLKLLNHFHFIILFINKFLFNISFVFNQFCFLLELNLIKTQRNYPINKKMKDQIFLIKDKKYYWN